ncbi:RibH Riboflavin synthase beta-chain [Pyrenophora tritici-repentis]|nr:RibH Riboflavin synthase beta-chain [Pyrenophora tritici-repentis]
MALGVKGVAIGNGILTTEDEDQAWSRARLSEGLYQMELAGEGVETVITEFSNFRFDADIEGEALARLTKPISATSDRRTDVGRRTDRRRIKSEAVPIQRPGPQHRGLGLPVIDGRLALRNYVFVSLRLEMGRGKTIEQMRPKEAYFRDALVKARTARPSAWRATGHDWTRRVCRPLWCPPPTA